MVSPVLRLWTKVHTRPRCKLALPTSPTASPIAHPCPWPSHSTSCPLFSAFPASGPLHRGLFVTLVNSESGLGSAAAPLPLSFIQAPCSCPLAVRSTLFPCASVCQCVLLWGCLPTPFVELREGRDGEISLAIKSSA